MRLKRSAGVGYARRLFSGALACGVMWVASASARFEAGATAQAKPVQAGEVLVVLNEQMLNALLEAMLSLPSPPAFPLSRSRSEGREASRCASEVVLERESMGTRTAVRFTEKGIHAPVAFRGSYDAPLVGCLKFEGWAETNFALSFDREKQTLEGRIDVREVHLKNVPSILGNGVTQMVQEAIDRRVNPLQLLRAEQLGTRIPVTKEQVLRLRAREVRHEVAQRELRLRIFYEVVRGD